MRWPCPRFTVRRIMVAVAVLALILGGSLEAIRLKRYRDECLTRAATHAESERYSRGMEHMAREMAETAESFLAILQRWTVSRGSFLRMTTIIREAERKRAELAEQQKRSAADERGQEARYAEYAAYHEALKRKYLRAAARPWQSVEPDPPPPEPQARGPYWSERGEYHQALTAYEEALRNHSEEVRVLNDLAWFLATCPEATLRDGKRSVELATRACKGTGNTLPAYLDTLAAAHAEAGDFSTAVEVQHKTIGMLSPGDPNAESYRRRLEGYKANKPYREMAIGSE